MTLIGVHEIHGEILMSCNYFVGPYDPLSSSAYLHSSSSWQLGCNNFSCWATANKIMILHIKSVLYLTTWQQNAFVAVHVLAHSCSAILSIASESGVAMDKDVSGSIAITLSFPACIIYPLFNSAP